MYVSYMIYQANHIKTARQQREEDTRAGELAAQVGQLWHSLTPRRASGQRSSRPTAPTCQARVGCGPSTGQQAVCG